MTAMLTRVLPDSRTLAIAAMTALVGACSDMTPPVVCPDILKWSLEVSVFDAATGAPAATGATVVVHSAVFQDSVALAAEATPPLAPYMVTEDREKAGTYSVTVRKTG